MAESSLYREYRNKIESLAREQRTEVFYNSSAAHASIVHCALAKYAHESIDIFSSSMSTDISNNTEYITALTNFLSEDCGRQIRIVLTTPMPNWRTLPIFKTLKGFSSQVQIRTSTQHLLYNGSEAHFTVVDNRAFRLETDIVKHMAFGNFNSPSQAETLHRIFDQAFNNAQEELFN